MDRLLKGDEKIYYIGCNEYRKFKNPTLKYHIFLIEH